MIFTAYAHRDRHTIVKAEYVDPVWLVKAILRARKKDASFATIRFVGGDER